MLVNLLFPKNLSYSREPLRSNLYIIKHRANALCSYSDSHEPQITKYLNACKVTQNPVLTPPIALNIVKECNFVSN